MVSSRGFQRGCECSFHIALEVHEINRALRGGMSFGSGVLAPALSEPKARSRAPARRLCDGVRRSRPTPCRQPEHRSHQTRSAAAASFARCIIVKVYYRQSGGAGSGGSPDKAGAYCEELQRTFWFGAKSKGYKSVVPLLYRLSASFS